MARLQGPGAVGAWPLLVAFLLLLQGQDTRVRVSFCSLLLTFLRRQRRHASVLWRFGSGSSGGVSIGSYTNSEPEWDMARGLGSRLGAGSGWRVDLGVLCGRG